MEQLDADVCVPGTRMLAGVAQSRYEYGLHSMKPVAGARGSLDVRLLHRGERVNEDGMKLLGVVYYTPCTIEVDKLATLQESRKARSLSLLEMCWIIHGRWNWWLIVGEICCTI